MTSLLNSLFYVIVLPSDSPAASSSEIHDLVKNENLQKLIYNIDYSENPENVSFADGAFPVLMNLSLFYSILQLQNPPFNSQNYLFRAVKNVFSLFNRSLIKPCRRSRSAYLQRRYKLVPNLDITMSWNKPLIPAYIISITDLVYHCPRSWISWAAIILLEKRCRCTI